MPTVTNEQAGLIQQFAMVHPVAAVFLVLALAVAVAIIAIALTIRSTATAKPELLVQLLQHNNSVTEQTSAKINLIMERQETILASVTSHDDVLKRMAGDIDSLSGRVQALEEVVCHNSSCPVRQKEAVNG